MGWIQNLQFDKKVYHISQHNFHMQQRLCIAVFCLRRQDQFPQFDFMLNTLIIAVLYLK